MTHEETIVQMVAELCESMRPEWCEKKTEERNGRPAGEPVGVRGLVEQFG